jgi:hypothetical protein
MLGLRADSVQYTFMGSKPKVVVTRILPEAVEARLRRDYDPHFNADEHVYSTEPGSGGCGARPSWRARKSREKPWESSARAASAR